MREETTKVCQSSEFYGRSTVLEVLNTGVKPRERTCDLST